MKITICAYDAPGNIDGPSAWMKRLLPWLKNRGVHCRVIFFAAHHPNLPVVKFMAKAGIEYKLIYWEKFTEEQILEVIEDVQHHRPDLFIASYFPQACEACRWIRQAGIATMAILHNDNDVHYALVRDYACAPNNYIEHVVSVSKFIETKISKGLPVTAKMHLVPCGAPITGKKVPLPVKGNLKVIYAGRIEEKQKQISLLAKAFCLAASQVPGTEYVIYGSGSAEKSVKRILATEGKGLPVKFGGMIESSKMLQFFLQNHVFVLLSDFEGIPISLMEAMGCGLVPVCTNIESGVSEIVEDRKTGFLVANREGAFVDAIRTIKQNAGLHAAISNNAIDIISKGYAEEICNERWLKAFSDAVLTAGPQASLIVPTLDQLKKIRMSAEFKENIRPIPSGTRVHLSRFKSTLGILKRRIWYKP